MSEPMFSVIVPVKNSEKYLAECLDNLLGQNFPAGEREILCVDDLSGDGSLALLQAYAEKYPEVKVFQGQGRGPGAARNLAMSNAKGRYILFLDSDDRLSGPKVLRDIFQKMEAENLDLLNFGAEVEFEDKELEKSRYREVQRYKARKSKGIFSTGKELLRELMHSEAFLGSACLLCLRRSCIEEQHLRFPDLFHAEDEVFCLKAVLKAGKAGHTGQSFYLRRVRHGSLTTRPDNIHAFQERLEAVRLLHETIEGEDSPWLADYLAKYMQDICRRFSALPQEEQARSGAFSPWEAAYLRLMGLTAELFTRAQAAYLFPWHLFRKGERVIIYGAGNVGRDFARQLQEFDYVKLIGVVDRNGPKVKIPETRVDYPQSLKDMDYDALLLSVQDKSLADSIKKDLAQLGIEESKVRWDGEHYLKKDFYEGCYFPKLSERKDPVEV